MAVMYTINVRVAGDMREALAWSTDMVDWIKANHNDTARCLTRVGGPQGVLVFGTTYDDMGAFQDRMEKIQADSGYWERVEAARSKGLFDLGAAESAIWTDVA